MKGPQPLWFKVWLVTFTTVMVVAGLVSLESVQRLDRNRDRDEARQCETSWEVRQGIRDGIDRAARVPVEALIAVAVDENTDPAIVDAFRASTEQGIDDAVAEVPLPTCDLEAARRELDR